MAEQAAAAEAAKAVRTLGLPVDVDPGKALLDEIAWTQGHVNWLRDKVQELDAIETLTRRPEPDPEYDDGEEHLSANPGAHALVWGQTEYRNKTGGEDHGQTIVEQAGVNIWYQLYMRERDHLAKVCALALRAGIEERRVKLAEQQGEMVAVVVKRILDALNLTPAQLEQVPVIVPREFRALAMGA